MEEGAGGLRHSRFHESRLFGSVLWWNKSNKMQQLRLFFAMALLYMFRVTIPPIIRSTYAVYGLR